MKCMCKANDPDPDIREEYCDGVTMTLFSEQTDDYEALVWWHCHECGSSKWVEVKA